jgi:peptidoglycan/xylan/chitin deacetylase (PgdA/CDA1 family)
MKLNFITLAARAKGPLALLKRTRNIAKRYGLTPEKMDQALHLFAQILKRFDCGASFALTTVVLKRNRDMILKYLDQNIEFVVHGYTHVDYPQLAPEQQLAHLRRAREAFAAAGVNAVGFRSPYLRREPHLYTAIETVGFSYVSNQPIIWDVLGTNVFTSSTYASYERAIAFYDPWPASEQPSLPQLYNQLVEIPVSLPDDEMLLDRLGGEPNVLIERAWRSILSKTYQRGELFTIQLHPERIAWCADGLSAMLAEARALSPSVWLARLDEIATWWRAHAATTVDVREPGDGALHLSVAGPPGTTILARGVEVLAPAKPWADDYQQVTATTCAVRAACRPFIGVSPVCPPTLISFLRQQGYIVEVNHDRRSYPIYLDRTDFARQDERPLLAQIEKSARPLIRLGRWPNGARSALSVTGDIDALTLWDYALRLFGI